MIYKVTLKKLIPQFFFPVTNITQMPAISFFEYAKSQLPQVYQNAPNFMSLLLGISGNKQYLYDIIRSLINVMNLNNSGNGTGSARPSGIYLQMLASIFNAPYSMNSNQMQILNSIQNTIVFVNSRGRPSDFHSYFILNGLGDFFTNNGVEEVGNATIFFNVPVPDIIAPNTPNPYTIFQTNMLKLKAAGIEILITPGNIPFFQLGSLPTDIPPFEVAPGNAGFGVLIPDGQVINGGFFIST